RCAERTGDSAWCLSPDSKLLAACTKDGILRIWQAATLEQITQLQLAGQGPEHTLVLTADGMTLAGASDGDLGAWDAQTGKELWRQRLGTSLLWLRLSPDGKELVAQLSAGTVCCWDRDTGRETRHLGGQLLATSPDGKLLARLVG